MDNWKRIKPSSSRGNLRNYKIENYAILSPTIFILSVPITVDYLINIK